MADDYDTQLAAFMYGLGQEESGGNYRTPPNRVGASGKYQFLDSTWGNYGGYPKAYLAPPEIQDERARQLMGAYYRKFGDWGSVAQAWLGGPGSVGKNVSDGNIGSFAYARNVLRLAGLAPGSTPAPPPVASSGIAGKSAGTGSDPFAAPPDSVGPDLHDVDVQAQTILGMLSRPTTSLNQTTQAAAQ